jgi:hypothetical protein
MALSDLSSSQLQRLIQLVKEKESIQAKLNEINHSLENLEGGKATPTEPTAKKGHRRRGKLKDGLLKKLHAAGKEGLTVKELAASLKAKPSSVSVWFYTTGKKIRGIKKVGIARFAYTSV